jgi:hypothetical protein
MIVSETLLCSFEIFKPEIPLVPRGSREGSVDSMDKTSKLESPSDTGSDSELESPSELEIMGHSEL